MKTTACMVAVVAVAMLAGCIEQSEGTEVGSKVLRVQATPTTLVVDGVLGQGDTHQFQFSPPLGIGFVTADLTGTGDADLYTREGAPPLDGATDCHPGNRDSDELCFHRDVDGVLYLAVRGWAPHSEYHLEIVFHGIGTTP